MRAFSVRRSSSISIQPAMPADAVSPAAPHSGRKPQPARQRDREQVAQRGREHDADDREPQRRPRIAQRVVGRRVQPAERRRQQPDRGAGEDAPDVDARRRALNRPVCSSAAATTSPSARNAIADGTTKNAICRRPASSRRRNASRRRPHPAARARHRRQLGRRDRHAEQAHRQRVQQLRVVEPVDRAGRQQAREQRRRRR